MGSIIELIRKHLK
jgi:hypothetical protein